MSLHENAQEYDIGHVISNDANAPGVQWASQRGIPTTVVERSAFPGLVEFKGALLQAVIDTQPDIVALAGFMVVLQPEFVAAFSGRLVNIHPSLLPKFKGLNTHQRALEAGEAQHGASVHFVADGVDTGPIIAQGKVLVESADTPHTLAARTLAVEHRLYPWAIKHLAQGGIALVDGQVVYSDLVRNEAQVNGFILHEH